MPVQPSWILAASTAKGSGSGGGFLLIIVLAFGVVFLFSRSQKAARRRATAASAALVAGDRVITTSGLYATVVAAHDATFDLEVAEGVVLTFAKAAVTRRAAEPEAELRPEAGPGGQDLHHDGPARLSSEP